MEIVIENPSETTQSVTPNAATGHVTVAAAAAAAAAAVSAISETGTITTTTTTTTTMTTTTMTMTTTTTTTVTTATTTTTATSLDATKTTTTTLTTTTTTTTTGTNAGHSYHRSPRCNPIIYGNQSSVNIPEQDYYLTQRSPRPLSCTIESFNDGSTMRRVDRSGLLEISSIDPSSSSRFRHCRPIGAESIAGHAGTLPRRVDRSGLLEALPELPENRRSSEELLRTPYGVQEVTMIKPDVVALVRSPTNYDSSTRFSNPSPSLLRPPPKSPSPGTTSTSRMSPTSNVTRRADGDSGLPNERSLRFSSSTDTFLPIESSLGLQTRFPYKDKANFSSNSRNQLDNNAIEKDKKDSHGDKDIKDDRKETKPELLLSSSSKTMIIDEDDKDDNNDDNDVVPRGERAEAEGCENTANENLEEGRVSFNNATNNKLYHNDNVQTLTVIILSEQL